MGSYFSIQKSRTKKMKIFALLAIAVSALDYDGLGLKKPVDKGPRECNGHKLEDSNDGSRLWKCTSRNPSNKNHHLTKRCKLKCKNGKERSGQKKVYCKSGHGWVMRKGEKKVAPGKCV